MAQQRLSRVRRALHDPITLNGSPNNTNSSPYYYYDTDVLGWVTTRCAARSPTSSPERRRTTRLAVTVDAGFTLSCHRSTTACRTSPHSAPTARPIRPHSAGLAWRATTREQLYRGGLMSAQACRRGGRHQHRKRGCCRGGDRRPAGAARTRSGHRYDSGRGPVQRQHGRRQCHAVAQFNGDLSIAGSTGLAKATFGRADSTRVGCRRLRQHALHQRQPGQPSGFSSAAAAAVQSRQPTPRTHHQQCARAAVVGPTRWPGHCRRLGRRHLLAITDVQNGANNYLRERT